MKQNYVNIDGLKIQLAVAVKYGLIKRLSTYANEKGVTRQMARNLYLGKKIDAIELDGIIYVLMTARSKSYQKR